MRDIKKTIRLNKFRNFAFAIIGFLATLVGLVLLATLMLDLFNDHSGSHRDRFQEKRFEARLLKDLWIRLERLLFNRICQQHQLH